MKKMFIKSLALVALTISSFAATATFPLGTSIGIASLVPSKAGAMTHVTFANAGSGAATVAFFNAPTNVLTYTIGAYTNNVVSLTSTVVSFTNILGAVQSQTNATITSTPTLVGASTNNYPLLLTYVIPATTTVTLPLDPAINFFNGLTMTNSATNIAVTVQYVPAQ